jgi:hypothetical protein
MAGPCAIGAREPGQGREAAAFSGTSDAPQVAWPSPAGTLRAGIRASPPLPTCGRYRAWPGTGDGAGTQVAPDR